MISIAFFETRVLHCAFSFDLYIQNSFGLETRSYLAYYSNASCLEQYANMTADAPIGVQQPLEAGRWRSKTLVEFPQTTKRTPHPFGRYARRKLHHSTKLAHST